MYTVSENKVLCHPASVDSLSTSAATEDHVSMGGFAARKALKVIENVEHGNETFFLWLNAKKKH
jgi:histidine ammonia-lyase